MSLTIRKIEKDDYNEVEVLTREAFWNIYRPGCSEHLVLHNLHKNNKSIEDLELVVECEGKIVGHIIYSKGNIDKSKDETFITFGPVSASKYGIHLEGVPVEDEAPFFMVKTLKEDALKDIEGNFIFDECYNVNDEDVDEFDKNFEFKKKEVREGQLK